MQARTASQPAAGGPSLQTKFNATNRDSASTERQQRAEAEAQRALLHTQKLRQEKRSRGSPARTTGSAAMTENNRQAQPAAKPPTEVIEILE